MEFISLKQLKRMRKNEKRETKELRKLKRIKVSKITSEYILFNNGCKIEYDHDQDCCEDNYADFKQLEDTGIFNEEFELPLVFEAVNESGFRFGNAGKMYFVPCYSEQNGYYTTEINIFFDKVLVLGFDCEFIDC